jgi:hypothetical protein
MATNKKVEDKKESKSLEPKEVIQTLRTQLEEHKKQADHHHLMIMKAQGALEVLLQMHPEENKNNK